MFIPSHGLVQAHWAQPSATLHSAHVNLPAEIICEVLLHIPTRSLATMRAVSTNFACIVNAVLRSRLLQVTENPSHEIVLESCAPFAARSAHRQAIKFSQFDEMLPTFTQIASYGLAHSPPVTQFLNLDDDQFFGNEMVGLLLMTKDPEQENSATTPFSNSPASASSSNSSVSRSPANNSEAISIASGMTRMYRTFFEVSPSAGESPCAPSFISRTVSPTHSSALISANISCCSVSPQSAELHSGRIPPRPLTSHGTGQSTFQWFYNQIKLDAAKFLSEVEAGRAKETATSVYWFY